MIDTRRWGMQAEYRNTENEGAASPFALQPAGETGYEQETFSAPYEVPAGHTAPETNWHEFEHAEQTAFPPPASETFPAGLPQPDPYSAIRPALSPAHAHLTADEITLSFGRTPAIIALHHALASPLPQQAALAVLLGRAGRRSTRVHGQDMPIPAYLRMLSRLCHEAAEHGEQEFEAGKPAASGTARIRELATGSSGPDVREVQKALNTRAHSGLNPDGVFGPLTRAAVIAFQRANGLQVDGVVGAQTRHALFPLVGVTLHLVGQFGAERPITVASASMSRQSREAAMFGREDPPGQTPPPPTDNIWQLLIPNLPKTDPADGPLDTFRRQDSGIELPIPPLLTAPLLNISGMQLDSRQVQPGFQFNTRPLWQSSAGSPNPSGALVLAFQSVLALNKDKPGQLGHLEVAEGFQLGRPVFAQTSDGRDWTLQWFAQATWVDPFWRRGRWHLVQPFAQISTQLDLKTGDATLGVGAFPVNMQVDLIKDRLSIFAQGGIVTSWDLGSSRVEIGGQGILGLNITLGGK
ncbi:MAG: peptidoglycan-binding protein [Alphaproteobacteria bacterium]|nr:peptidoglycan-binding protein [Alphaproteobacteria bacterium]